MLLFALFLAAASAQPADDNAAPVPGEWAWLNIPGVEGPGARFSYETAIRRDGSRLGIRMRYDAADSRHPDRTVPVEALLTLDCAARTYQLLERGRPGSTRRVSHTAATPIGANSREWTLAYLLCPRAALP